MTHAGPGLGVVGPLLGGVLTAVPHQLWTDLRPGCTDRGQTFFGSGRPTLGPIPAVRLRLTGGCL